MKSFVNIERVRVLSRAFDSWVVEFRIPVEELLDQQRLVHHLRSVKQHISNSQSVPENCLVFDGIVRKASDEEFVDVVVRIKKLAVPSGAPRVTFADEEIAADLRYSNMHAQLDIFYLDEFDQVVTHDRVMRAIRSAGVTMELVDQELVMQKVSDILRTQNAVRGVPIAHGKLPGIGQDAEVEFFFQAVGDSHDVDLLYSTRRVRKGDLLCRKTPPRESAREGLNVLGQTLPPRAGFDILLVAGTNAVLSLDSFDVVADLDGIAIVSRVSRRIKIGRGYREIPDSITVKVDPILKIKASELTELTTSQAVEVTGTLRMGTRILSESEVFIEGDVEAGASVTAADDILIKGSVIGATLSSQGSIVTSQSVQGAEVHAQGDVTIAGDITDSSIEGNAITARSASGSRIVARKSVTLESIVSDEDKILTTICVGMNDFFLQRLRENQKFLEAAYSNLERIRMVVGDDIYDGVTSSNTHTMLMRMLTKLRQGSTTHTRKQVDVYRQLIQSIPPTKAIIAQKELECRGIAERLSEQSSNGEGIIVVKERIASRTVASIDGVQGVIEKSDQGAQITVSDGKLVVSQ